MKCQVLWVFVFFRSSFLAVWCDVDAVSGLCALFSLLPPSLCENVTLCWSLSGGKWAQRLMWWMFDQFPLKVCVWSGYECIFYVLWIKGKSEIKLNLTRYDTLLTVTYFWLYINWTANTLIHMYRDLGHGQPRFSSESSLESVLKKRETLLAGPAQTNNGVAARLP